MNFKDLEIMRKGYVGRKGWGENMERNEPERK
jgi:hypothetical protein